MSATLDDLPAPIDPLEDLDPERREVVIRFSRAVLPHLDEAAAAFAELEPYQDHPQVQALIAHYHETVRSAAHYFEFLKSRHPELLLVRRMKEEARRGLANGRDPGYIASAFAGIMADSYPGPEHPMLREVVALAVSATLIESTPPTEA